MATICLALPSFCFRESRACLDDPVWTPEVLGTNRRQVSDHDLVRPFFGNTRERAVSFNQTLDEVS